MWIKKIPLDTKYNIQDNPLYNIHNLPLFDPTQGVVWKQGREQSYTRPSHTYSLPGLRFCSFRKGERWRKIIFWLSVPEIFFGSESDALPGQIVDKWTRIQGTKIKQE